MVVDRWKHFLLIHIDPLLLATIWMVSTLDQRECVFVIISRISNEPLTMLGVEVTQQNYCQSSVTQMFKNYVHLLVK